MGIAVHRMKYIILVFMVLIIIVSIMLLIYLKKCNSQTVDTAINITEKIRIGGVKQSISIRGKNTSNPILLFIHGGPGYVLEPIITTCNHDLESNFIVVNWDQRGAGNSYTYGIAEKSMTIKQFVEDGHELTEYLKKKFNKDKIFILGHSFGTIIGLKLADKYPQDYYAYIASGQVVSFAENEKLSYKYALESAKNTYSQIAINELEKIGAPDNNGQYKDEAAYDITYKWMSYFGGELFGKTSSDEIDNIILNHKDYRNDHNKFYEGIDFSQELFEDEEVIKLDFRKEIKNLKLPAFFLCGYTDYDTPFVLVQEYFNKLNAPKKQLYWFEKSAHFPFYEEPYKFNGLVVSIANLVLEDSLK